MSRSIKQVVLVVDDSKSSRSLLVDMLRDLSVEVIEAENGQEGASAALACMPDLILMDYRMPVMEGPEAVEAIRQHPLAARIPILMITGETAPEKMLSSFQSGVLDFIHKPFDPVQLKAQIASYLRLAEINRRFVLATIDRVTERPNVMALQEDVENEEGVNPLLFIRSRQVVEVRHLYGAGIGDELERSLCARIEEIARSIFRVECRLYVIDRGELVLRFLDAENYIDGESAPVIMRAFERYLVAEEFEVENLLFTCEFRLVVSLPGKGVLEDGLIAFADSQVPGTAPSLVFAGEVVAQHREVIRSNLQTLTSIRNSLREEQVTAYAQPLVDLGTEQVVGYECLMRIKDSAGRILLPGSFLQVAKSSRYYPELTMAMIDQVYRAFQAKPCLYSLNFSSVDIETPQVVKHTLAMLSAHPDFARHLLVELVEQEEGSDFSQIRDFLKKISSCGARAAIDDFGSGYSNLRRLSELDFHFVKIDGTLVRDIVVSERARKLVDWVVSFADQAEVELIAEFVETPEHRDQLLKMGVGIGQGFYYGRPRPLEELLREE
ncbi:diguanylate phosphodiesterase [Alkalispirochaeta sphaeroplastigenens]|uniref:Diguanylate phosphodiesterase n=1 Tax=Alkalispirochaeta sphaeroplastigenens TaxID=1187066 RepID=A0A2S4JU69_9SPIO|nr:EAL domain-containing response regulator [Alkalispirochaeta sphaeroplastigenens]POR03033.1 diguanylate phosphodiesterase [Alkalispirochaeta sphaeroplastigenens]